MPKKRMKEKKIIRWEDDDYDDEDNDGNQESNFQLLLVLHFCIIIMCFVETEMRMKIEQIWWEAIGEKISFE